MLSTRSVLKILLAAAAMLSIAHADCPSGWVFYGTSCYKFGINASNLSTWTGCQSTCTDLGATMLCIANSAENSFVQSQINEVYTWLGYSDYGRSPLFNFAWVSGCTSTYAHWNSGEPNNARGIEWYAHMYGNGLWNDAGDTNADRPFWSSDKVFSCACQVTLSQVSE